jgi:protein O-mannosyl-transferase
MTPPGTAPIVRGLPRWVDAALVILAAVAAFLPGIFGGFLGWDDDQNFLENSGYRGLGPRQLGWMLTTFHMGHWKPLTWLTHGVDWALWGMHPLGYKVGSIALHVAAALAFLALARRLLRLARPGYPPDAVRAGALGAALFFAVHPLRVEPVAWLSARGDLVAGLAAFLSVLAYLRGTRAGYWMSVVLFAVALSGKSMPVTLPLVLLVLDVYPLRRLGPFAGGGSSAGGWWNPPARRIYLEKTPFLVLSAAATVLAVLARIEFGSLAEVNEVGWGARLAASVYALAFPLWKMVIPVGLSPLYDLRAALGRGPWPFVMAGAAVAGLTTLAVARARRWPAFAAVWASYVIMLLPVSGLVQNGPQIAADRYTYLAGGGWALLAGGGLAWCAAHVMARSPRAALARGVLGLTVAATLVLVSASAWQALIWHNSVTLWSRVVELEPDGAIARTGLGTALLADGRPLKAAAHYRRALEIFPRLPEANLGLALILAGEGRGAEALLHGRQAVARQPQRAGFRMVFAEILWGADRREESLAELREGARLAPTVPLFPYLLAVKLARVGRGPEAIAALEEGRRLERAAHLPGLEGDRFTALVYESIDPPTAVAAWQRYVIALSRVPRPTALQLSQLAYGIAALDALTKSSTPPPAPHPAPPQALPRTPR